MDTSEAKKIHTEIMRRASQISADHGSPTVLVKGSVIQASREKWEEKGKRGDADEWRKTVFGLVRKRRGKEAAVSLNGTSSAATPAMGDKKRVQSNRNNGKGSWIDNYRELAMKYNALPVDAYLADQWHCSPDTIGRIRGKLRMAGFEFERKGGVIYVTDRPKPAPTVVVAPIVPAAPIVEAEPEVKQLVFSEPLQDAAWPRFETLTSDMLATLKAIVQMEAGAYRKLGEIEGLLRELVAIWKT